MYVVAMYKQGVSLFWDGRDWKDDRDAAHQWRYKQEAESFAADVMGPWEAVVIAASG